jgi:hypothetical protein
LGVGRKAGPRNAFMDATRRLRQATAATLLLSLFSVFAEAQESGKQAFDILEYRVLGNSRLPNTRSSVRYIRFSAPASRSK